MTSLCCNITPTQKGHTTPVGCHSERCHITSFKLQYHVYLIKGEWCHITPLCYPIARRCMTALRCNIWHLQFPDHFCGGRKNGQVYNESISQFSQKASSGSISWPLPLPPLPCLDHENTIGLCSKVFSSQEAELAYGDNYRRLLRTKVIPCKHARIPSSPGNDGHSHAPTA